MGNLRIKLSPKADEDFASIVEYKKQFNQSTADKFTLGFILTISQLKAFPFIGTKLENKIKSLKGKGYRFLPYDKHAIIYSINDTEEFVLIETIYPFAKDLLRFEPNK